MMFGTYRAVHHFDVRWHRTLYRVSSLESTLQVDVSFWASEEFVAAGATFRLLFGEPARQYVPAQRSSDHRRGMAVSAARPIERGPRAMLAGYLHDRDGPRPRP